MTGFDDLLAKNDPDRRLAALFAEPELRDRLFALYAFYQEIARIPDAVSEPMIGEMRLAWAREAVEDLYADPPKVRRHEIYEALSGLIAAPGGPDKATLLDIIEARSADLGAGPFPTRDDRRDYIDRTAVAVMRAGVCLCKPDIDLSGQAGQAVQAAGRLWGFAGLVRALPALAGAGRPPFAAEEMAAEALTEADMQRGRKRDAVRAAMGGLIEQARIQAGLLHKTRAALPAEVFPAVGYAGLARGYLRRAAHLADPYREPVERALFLRQARLVWGSLTGRI